MFRECVASLTIFMRAWAHHVPDLGATLLQCTRHASTIMATLTRTWHRLALGLLVAAPLLGAPAAGARDVREALRA